MLIDKSEIIPLTLNAKFLLNFGTLRDYCEMEFQDFRDALLIDTIISRRDIPLLIVRLLNYRNKEQRKKIDRKFRERKGDMNIKMLDYILDYITDNPERCYLHILLDDIN